MYLDSKLILIYGFRMEDCMDRFVKGNRKLYYALLFLALFPTIYQTFYMKF